MDVLAESPPWLLLVHHLPSEPGYLRVKVWRRLRGLGAIILKGSVYALPHTAQNAAALRALLAQIMKDGGDGFVLEARFIEGLSDGKVRALFRESSTAEYAALAVELLALERLPDPRRMKQARRRFEQAAAVDFFGATGREEVERSLAEAESDGGRAQAPVPDRHAPHQPSPVAPARMSR